MTVDENMNKFKTDEFLKIEYFLRVLFIYNIITDALVNNIRSEVIFDDSKNVRFVEKAPKYSKNDIILYLKTDGARVRPV